MSPNRILALRVVPGAHTFRLRPGGIVDLLLARIPMESAPNVGDSSDSCPVAMLRGKPHAPDFFGFSVTYKILKLVVA